MLMTAVICFALAALLGLYLLSFILRDKKTPKAVAFIHGPVAGIGLILLIIYSYLHAASPITSLVLFILAAFGGIMLLYRDLSGQPVPKAMAIGHGATAIVALIFLLIFTFVS